MIKKWQHNDNSAVGCVMVVCRHRYLRDGKKFKWTWKWKQMLEDERWPCTELYMNCWKMKVRITEVFNYGVTSELQKKWTSVCMTFVTEWGGSLPCALQNSARIVALLLANYISLSVLFDNTKLYLLMCKIDLATLSYQMAVTISHLE